MAALPRGLLEYHRYFRRVMELEDENERPRVPRRYLRDGENPIECFSDVQFKNIYRFNKESVLQMMNDLHIQDRLQTDSNRGLPVAPLMQLLTALRYYATGSFQTVLGDLHTVNLSQATVCRLLHRVSVVIAEQLRAHVKFPETPQGLREHQQLFYQAGDFPEVTGLIDGTHIPIKSPGGPFSELFRNRKRFFSLNVQVVCGPRGELLDVVARWPGSTHDVQVFDNSRVKMRYEQGLLTGCLVGDSGYPCTEYLLTPLLQTCTQAEERYNVAHKRVRNIVECCIGRWKRRLLCLKKGLARSPKRAVATICACAVLHNIAVRLNDELPEGNMPNREVPVQPLHQPCRGPGAAFRRAFIARHFELEPVLNV